MTANYQELHGTLNRIIKNAHKVQTKTDDYNREKAMEDVIRVAEQMKEPLVGLRSGADVDAAIRESRMPELQHELGEYVLSAVEGSGFPSDSEVREPFKTLLNEAKNSEKLISQVEGVSKQKTIRAGA